MNNIFTTDFWTFLLRNASAAALQSIFKMALIIVLYLVARAVLFRVITRGMNAFAAREERQGRVGAASRALTMGGLLKSVTGYVLVFLAAIMLLRVVGVDPVPLLTTAGVLGLAVGFGAQKLVRDVISGFFILLENQYVVGEYVTIGLVTGDVEEIGMRTTRLRDDIGRLVIISNGDITLITNHSRGKLLATVEVSVAAGSDLDRVCSVLKDVGAALSKERADVVAPFECDGVSAMDGTKVTLRLVGKVDPKSFQDVQQDLRRRVRDALVKNEIQMA